MLLPVILLSFIVCVWWIASRSLTDALIGVFLPIYLLIPPNYVFEVPHVTVINPYTAAILPIAACALLKYHSQWRFQRADLWLLLFLLGHAYPYARVRFTIGIHDFVSSLFYAFCPYVVGKLLLEQTGIRERFLRRMLGIMSFIAILEIIEFRLGKNLFVMISDTLFYQAAGLIEQVRGGYERARGPFGGTITAGLIFGSVWIFALWLDYIDKSNIQVPQRRLFGIRRSQILPWLMVMAFLMTWSRGPWVGAALAFAVSRIGYAKHVARTAVLIVIVTVAAGFAGYEYFEAYTSIDYWSAQTYEQQTAIYRKQLLTAYQPIVQEGGLFGWGEGFPKVGGQSSIDNEYLWLRLTQGPFGFWLFFLFVGEGAIALIQSARKSHLKSDFTFAMSMLAVLCGMLVTLLTTSLGVPAYQLFFLCIGWSVSLRLTKESTAATPVTNQLEQSYTKIFA